MIHSWHSWRLLFRDPYILLTLGCIFILVGAASMSTRVAPGGRRTPPVYEDKEPKKFWWSVATWFLGGIILIGIFIYRFY